MVHSDWNKRNRIAVIFFLIAIAIFAVLMICWLGHLDLSPYCSGFIIGMAVLIVLWTIIVNFTNTGATWKWVSPSITDKQKRLAKMNVVIITSLMMTQIANLIIGDFDLESFIAGLIVGIMLVIILLIVSFRFGLRYTAAGA